MSIEHMAMVFAAGGIEAKERLLLLAYTNRCDDHGFCWPGEDRLVAETGMSASTVRRAKKSLTDMGLVKSIRRPDTSSMTRINLKLLASMRRPERAYDDNLIEKFGFTEDRPQPSDTGFDLRTGQDDLSTRSSCSDGQVILTPGPGQDDLKTISEPSKETSVEPDAPSARSAQDAGGFSSGSSGRASESGSAASSNDQPSPTEQQDRARPASGEKRQPGHSRQQLDLARQVCELFPPELGVALVPVLTDAILGALAGDCPAGDRTVAQLGARIERRWNHHGYASKFFAGELRSPVGAAVGMVRPLKAGDRYGCANPRCEDGADVDTGEGCSVCPERIAARQAERRQDAPDPAPRPVPPQRPNEPQWWECASCCAPGKGTPPSSGLCSGCTVPDDVAELSALEAPF